ncbi:hypothetical protein EXW58_04705 [Bacillus mycoides]|uniref:hypothetical protein n=1 Tax=Bacillus mycoides TaxID=1405 RepID=UPI001C020F7D|nr:hypothetical protein [Bacillus mycoides]QWG26938.1 hypothetical protein EXW58_04705 [Bacillus mycoides]
MANGRMQLSQSGFNILYKVMNELELQEKRPEALRVAFAKGITDTQASLEIPKRNSSSFTIPAGVIAKEDEYLLYKHLIIDKVQRQLNTKEIDTYMLHFIEHGLEIMNQEICTLSQMDNYILYLAKKHS